MISQFLDFAERLFDTLTAMWTNIYEFCTSPAYIDIGIARYDLPWDYSWFQLCFGGAVVFILGFAIIKFFTDIIL